MLVNENHRNMHFEPVGIYSGSVNFVHSAFLLFTCREEPQLKSFFCNWLADYDQIAYDCNILYSKFIKCNLSFLKAFVTRVLEDDFFLRDLIF